MRTKHRTSARLRRALAGLGLLACLAAMALAVSLAVKGYTLYRNALHAHPVAEYVEQLQAAPGYVPLAELPPLYLDAVVAVEDCRFRQHNGVDLISIGRAVWANLTSWSLKEGGSTITQQLAKNLYFTQEKQFARKVAEMLMAFELEAVCDKDTILELYVNTIYFGSGYTGVGAACAGYFGVTPRDMDADQCTLLAGIPQAPSVYSPAVHPELARQRQQTVVKRLVEEGCLSAEDGQAILAAAAP